MKRFFPLILFLILASCSSENEAQKQLDKLKTPNESTDLVEKTKPTNVPPISGAYTYFGKQILKIDELQEFTLIKGGALKVVDFEFTSSQDETLNLSDFYSLFVGDCPNYERRFTWYQLSASGEILAAEQIKLFESYEVPAKTRSLLRVEFSEAQACSQIYSNIKVEKF